MSRIREHDGAEITGGMSTEDAPAESLIAVSLHKRREVAGVVDMCMRENDRIQIADVERKLAIDLICLLPPSLVQPAVEQNAIAGFGCNQMHGAGHGASSPEELNDHDERYGSGGFSTSAWRNCADNSYEIEIF